jgi:hypothetical protein
MGYQHHFQPLPAFWGEQKGARVLTKKHIFTGDCLQIKGSTVVKLLRNMVRKCPQVQETTDLSTFFSPISKESNGVVVEGCQVVWTRSLASWVVGFGTVWVGNGAT